MKFYFKATHRLTGSEFFTFRIANTPTQASKAVGSLFQSNFYLVTYSTEEAYNEWKQKTENEKKIAAEATKKEA